MGETRDWLEEHGCEGRTFCAQAGCWIIIGSCMECDGECPEWKPDEPEPADQSDYFDWLGGAIRAGWM